jgi:phage protein U
MVSTRPAVARTTTVEPQEAEREATAEAVEARARLGRAWPLVAGAAGVLGVVIALLVWLL